MKNWTAEKLGTHVRHKKGFAFKSESFQASGHPIVRVTDFTENSVSSKALQYIDEQTYHQHIRYRLDAGDVIIQTVGSWPNNPASVVGKVVRIPKKLDGALLNQNAVIIYPGRKIDPSFLYYLLRSKNFKGYIINCAQGAANQASITLDSIFRFEFYLPPINQQRRIAAILSQVDDLIENNQRHIALLERLVEEIYREWFVRLRFPSYENINVVKGVPSGWKVRTLGSFADEIKRGVKKKDLADDEKYVGLEHIPRHSIALTTWTTADTVESGKLLFQERDILFGKIRPYLHKVAIAHFSGACSSDTIVLRPKEKYYEGYLLFTVFSETFVELATVASKGTKMPRADWSFLKRLQLIVPHKELLERYQTQFDIVFRQIANLLNCNQLLSMSRDLLLPRLISGKLSVENLDIQFPPGMIDELDQTRDPTHHA